MKRLELNEKIEFYTEGNLAWAVVYYKGKGENPHKYRIYQLGLDDLYNTESNCWCTLQQSESGVKLRPVDVLEAYFAKA